MNDFLQEIYDQEFSNKRTREYIIEAEQLADSFQEYISRTYSYEEEITPENWWFPISWLFTISIFNLIINFTEEGSDDALSFEQIKEGVLDLATDDDFFEEFIQKVTAQSEASMDGESGVSEESVRQLLQKQLEDVGDEKKLADEFVFSQLKKFMSESNEVSAFMRAYSDKVQALPDILYGNAEELPQYFEPPFDEIPTLIATHLMKTDGDQAEQEIDEQATRFNPEQFWNVISSYSGFNRVFNLYYQTLKSKAETIDQMVEEESSQFPAELIKGKGTLAKQSYYLAFILHSFLEYINIITVDPLQKKDDQVPGRSMNDDVRAILPDEVYNEFVIGLITRGIKKLASTAFILRSVRTTRKFNNLQEFTKSKEMTAKAMEELFTKAPNPTQLQKFVQKTFAAMRDNIPNLTETTTFDLQGNRANVTKFFAKVLDEKVMRANLIEIFDSFGLKKSIMGKLGSKLGKASKKIIPPKANQGQEESAQ